MGDNREAQFTRSIYLTASTGFLQVSRLSAGSTSELLVDAPTRVQRRMGFKLDGASSYYGRCVCDHLDQVFSNKWIGRGDSFAWPPRFPD